MIGYQKLDVLRDKLAPILLRRTRAEVLPQLPARTDSTVYVEMAAAQRSLYQREQQALMRHLGKKYLKEAERKQVLCHLNNLRMVCDSTHLIDRESNVAPKLDELAELLRDLFTSGPRKIVLFSQWETMIRLTAEWVEKLGFRCLVLHGGVPGKDRRGLIERFRDDPEIRIFLSTDAGGTGLNMQAADTVINLEVPWNPAVLEQRIARVHRLGQHRPVQVFQLVTRDSIEERVLKTLSRKRELFDGVFQGGLDEVVLTNLGHRAFLDTVRELVDPSPVPLASSAQKTAKADTSNIEDAGSMLLHALAKAKVITDAQSGEALLQFPLPNPELLERAAAILLAFARQLRT